MDNKKIYSFLFLNVFTFSQTNWSACLCRLFSLAWAFCLSLVPSGLKCVSARSNWLNKQTNKPDTADKLLNIHDIVSYFSNWLHSLHFIGHRKFVSCLANYGQPNTLADNQKLQPGCPRDDHFFLNLDTGNLDIIVGVRDKEMYVLQGSGSNKQYKEIGWW